LKLTAADIANIRYFRIRAMKLVLGASKFTMYIQLSNREENVLAISCRKSAFIGTCTAHIATEDSVLYKCVGLPYCWPCYMLPSVSLGEYADGTD